MGQDQSALKAQEAELTKTFGSYVDESKYDYLPEPSKMDWLSNIHEKGQSLFTYLRRYHNVPDSSRNTLYLIAVDNIDDMSSSEFYDKIAEYVAIFFQMKVRLLDRLDLSIIQSNIRLNEDHRPQYLTKDIFKHLVKLLPSDAFALIGITSADLYPSKSWDFVFGESNYHKRIGVFSFHRLRDIELSADEITQYQNLYGVDMRAFMVHDEVINRTCKLVTHEISHMFGIDHCVYFNCVMCGIMGIHELDRWSYLMCPICIQKLYAAHPFDIIERHNKLLQFFIKNEIAQGVDACRKIIPSES